MDNIDVDTVATVREKRGRQLQDGKDIVQGPGKVDPVLALELRLRWLEALILGMKQDSVKDRKGKAKEVARAGIGAGGRTNVNLKHGENLTRLAENIQSQLDKAVEGNEGLKRFMDSCT